MAFRLRKQRWLLVKLREKAGFLLRFCLYGNRNNTYLYCFFIAVLLIFFLLSITGVFKSNLSVNVFIPLFVINIVGLIIGPFLGGNEGEWTQYLEKALKSERDRFMSILNSMNEGVVIIGSDLKIRFMNPAMIKQFGDGIGKHCYRHLYGLNEPCENRCKLPTVLKGNSEKAEYTFPNGSTYELISSPFSDSDQVPCMLTTFINVTTRKEIERELIRINELKSHMLSEKTRQLAEISKEVEKLGEEKRHFVRFLSVVAHDLQAPLAAIQTYVWEILDGNLGGVPKVQKDILERITVRIQGLSQLIGNLLDIPRIDSGQILNEMKETSISDVILKSVDALGNLGKDKGIFIKTELPHSLPLIWGSNMRLQEVLGNLISNAVKYSTEGTVVIRAKGLREEVIIEVMDTGIGISPEDMSHLFSDFFRGSNVIASGTGLGLSISKRIVEAHGGKIWAESPCPETGKGSKFSIKLPVARPSGQTKKK